MFRVNHLIGFGARKAAEAQPPGGASYTFLEGRMSTTAGNVSYTSVNFGAEPGVGETRHILVGIAFQDLSFGRTISSVTIGGVSATRLVRVLGDNQLSNAEIWMAEVPTGISGTVAVNGQGNRTAIGVYRVMDLASATPVDTEIITTNGAGPADLSVSSGDIAFVAVERSAIDDLTLTGVTEDYDVSAGTQHRGAFGSTTAASTGTLSVNASPTASGRKLAAVALR